MHEELAAHGQRQLVLLGEQDRGHRVLDDGADEGEQEDDHQDRQRHRQQHAAEALPGRRAVDARGLLDLVRQRVVVALDGPHMHRDASGVGQHERGMGVQPQCRPGGADAVEDGIDRDQREHGREHLHQHQAGQQLASASKAQARQRIGGGGGQRERHQGREEGHLDRVPQPAQHGQVGRDGLPVRPGHRQAQHIAPVLQADAGRDQRAGSEVARAQRDREHREEWKQHGRAEAQQERVRGEQAPALRLRLDQGHDDGFRRRANARPDRRCARSASARA